MKFAQSHPHLHKDWWVLVARAAKYLPYDPNFGDTRVCRCGHHYYRHFDGYDDNRAVGCKYCPCDIFVERKPGDPEIEWDGTVARAIPRTPSDGFVE